jgi:hypothetical protein
MQGMADRKRYTDHAAGEGRQLKSRKNQARSVILEWCLLPLPGYTLPYVR